MQTGFVRHACFGWRRCGNRAIAAASHRARKLGIGESMWRVGGGDVMQVNPSFPAKTVPEFISHAKSNPGKVIAGVITATQPH
jgi:hypothetical protein